MNAKDQAARSAVKWRKPIGLLLVIGILAALWGSIAWWQHLAFATAVHDTSGQNAAEAETISHCVNGIRRNSLWFNTYSGGAATDPGAYHSQSIVITTTSDSVTVYFHRSQYRCGSTDDTDKAAGVQITGVDEGSSYGVSLSPPSGKIFDVTGGGLSVGQYWDFDNAPAGTLSGINNLPGSPITLTFRIYRQNTQDGSTGITDVTVTIIRQGSTDIGLTAAVDVTNTSSNVGSVHVGNNPDYPISGSGVGTIAPTSTSSDGTVLATPGDTAFWWFAAKNYGAGMTYPGFDTMTQRTGWGSAPWEATDVVGDSAHNWKQWTLNSGTSTGQFGYYNWGLATTGPNSYTKYPASGGFTMSDVGKTFCQSLRSSWNQNGSWAIRYSPWACVKVMPPPWLATPQTSMTNDNSNANSGWGTSESYNSSDETKMAYPGNTVTWKHSITIKDNPTTQDVKYFSTKSVAWTGDSSQGTLSSGTTVGDYKLNTPTETRTITQADVSADGSIKYCDTLNVNPNKVGGSQVNSGAHCVWAPFRYQLTPHTDVSSGGGGNNTPINFGETPQFKGKITNNGPTKSRPTNWEAFTFVIPKSNTGTLPTDASSLLRVPGSPFPSSVYGVTIQNYQTIGTKTNPGGCTVQYEPISVFYPAGSDPANITDNIICETGEQLKDALKDLNLGDKFCFALWVSPSWADPTHQDSTDRSYSIPACVEVSKSPQIQIKGADSRSGAARFGGTVVNTPGGFEGRFSADPVRGSWSQYGLLSNGPITSFGATGFTLDQNRANACRLLFANTSGAGGANCIGALGESYGNQNVTSRIITLPKVAEYSAAQMANLVTAGGAANMPGGATTDLNGLPSGTYYVTKSTTIQASTLKKNQHLVLVVASPSYSITIDGNIKPDDTDRYSSLSSMPSLTIIADKIYVTGGVTDLYGTYIARDRFNTCTSTSLSGLSGFNLAETLAGNPEAGKSWSGVCQRQLTITGAVISKNRPQLLRTNGAGRDDASVPSEIFRYTPNLYLTPYSLMHDGSVDKMVLDDMRQVPARL